MLGRKENENREVTDILPKNRIDKDTAEAMFYQFCDDWDIDYNDLKTEKQTVVKDRDDEGNTLEVGEEEETEQEAFDLQKKKVVKRIMDGHAIYSPDDESFIYTLVKPMKDGHGNTMKKSEPIKIGRGTEQDAWGLTGNKAKDNFKIKDHRIAGLTGLPIQAVGNLDPIDMKFLDAVLVLFLNG